MESFRTEIENPIVQKDIIDLERKIRLFKKVKLMTNVFVVFVWLEVYTVNVKKEYK